MSSLRAVQEVIPRVKALLTNFEKMAVTEPVALHP